MGRGPARNLYRRPPRAAAPNHALRRLCDGAAVRHPQPPPV